MAEQQGNATIALACTNCGAPLEIGSDVERFACAFCGTPQRVERKGGTVALRKLEGAIGAVQRGTDKTAAELAIVRLDKDLIATQRELDSLILEGEPKLPKEESTLIRWLVIACACMYFLLILRPSGTATIVVVAGYFGALYLVRRQRKAKRATLEHQMAAVQQQYRKEVRRLRDQCQKISERIAQQKQIADAPH